MFEPASTTDYIYWWTGRHLPEVLINCVGSWNEGFEVLSSWLTTLAVGPPAAAYHVCPRVRMAVILKDLEKCLLPRASLQKSNVTEYPGSRATRCPTTCPGAGCHLPWIMVPLNSFHLESKVPFSGWLIAELSRRHSCFLNLWFESLSVLFWFGILFTCAHKELLTFLIAQPFIPDVSVFAIS